MHMVVNQTTYLFTGNTGISLLSGHRHVKDEPKMSHIVVAQH